MSNMACPVVSGLPAEVLVWWRAERGPVGTVSCTGCLFATNNTQTLESDVPHIRVSPWPFAICHLPFYNMIATDRPQPRSK